MNSGQIQNAARDKLIGRRAYGYGTLSNSGRRNQSQPSSLNTTDGSVRIARVVGMAEAAIAMVATNAAAMAIEIGSCGEIP